jgi:hypothetical protein
MKPVQKFISYLFCVLCLFFGSGLLLAPGRFLGMFYWAPVDPHLSRIFGAALLAMAGWSANGESAETGLITVGEVFFTFIQRDWRHYWSLYYPLMVRI